MLEIDPHDREQNAPGSVFNQQDAQRYGVTQIWAARHGPEEMKVHLRALWRSDSKHGFRHWCDQKMYAQKRAKPAHRENVSGAAIMHPLWFPETASSEKITVSMMQGWLREESPALAAMIADKGLDRALQGAGLTKTEIEALHFKARDDYSTQAAATVRGVSKQSQHRSLQGALRKVRSYIKTITKADTDDWVTAPPPIPSTEREEPVCEDVMSGP